MRFLTTTRRASAALAILGWGAIIVLSVIPGSGRPHTGAGGFSEHFAAYLLVGLFAALGWPGTFTRLRLGAALTATAILAEIVQIYIPARNAEVGGAVSAASGAWSGLLIGLVLHHLITWRSAQQKSPPR